MGSRASRRNRFVLAVVVLAAVLAALLGLRRPAVVPATAPEELFSAERALRYVEAMSVAPRPTGSAANERARDSLLEWSAALGAEAEVQEATVVERRLPGWVRGARVTNVVARIAGTEPTGAVLLVSHHDTVPLSPGAADDASGVAALLETLRALQAAPPPRNDVIVLFTDAEEIGLYGAEAFLSRHPWARDVKVVVNLEARGSGGPSILFETGPVDAALMRRVADAAPHLIGASYAHDVYRYLPHDTDFSVFKEAGAAGFNFAFIGDFATYHSASDDLRRLDAESLQHHGTSTLGLARYFAEIDLANLPEHGTAIYFNLPWVGLVTYPSSWALPLAVAAALAVLLLLAVVLRRGRLRILPLAAALGIVPLAMAAAVVAVHFGNLVWQRALGLRDNMLGPTPWHLLGWILLAVAVSSLVLAALSRRPGALHLAAASFLWWAVLAVGAAIVLPSSSYLFSWPLAFALLALVPLSSPPVAPEDPARRGSGAAATALMMLAPVPAFLLWVPPLVLVGTALGSDGAALLGLAGALVAALLIPLWLSPEGAGRWALPLASGLVAVALLVPIALSAGHDVDRPRPNSLYYALDTETGEALWVSEDDAADAWTTRFLDRAEPRSLDGFFFRASDVLAAPAPPLPLDAAAVRIERAPSGRGELLVRVVPPPGTGEIRVALIAPGGVDLIRLDGQPVEPPPEGARDDVSRSALEVSFHAPPPGGLELLVAIEAGARLEVESVAHRYALPTLPDGPVPPRPPGLQPSRYSMTDRTLVRSHTVVGAPGAETNGIHPDD